MPFETLLILVKVIFRKLIILYFFEYVGISIRIYFLFCLECFLKTLNCTCSGFLEGSLGIWKFDWKLLSASFTVHPVNASKTANSQRLKSHYKHLTCLNFNVSPYIALVAFKHVKCVMGVLSSRFLISFVKNCLICK